MCNPIDEMSRFVTRVANLVREECRTTMLHDDMTLSRIMVYAQSIEEFKLGRISRTWKGVFLMIKVNLGSKRRFQVKKNLGVLRLNLRTEVVLMLASLLVLLVRRGTMGNAYWVPRVSLDVVKMDTK